MQSPTLGLARGLSCSSFLAAASMDAAAPSSSVSAITVGSSGSTHSEPEARMQDLKLKKYCINGVSEDHAPQQQQQQRGDHTEKNNKKKTRHPMHS